MSPELPSFLPENLMARLLNEEAHNGLFKKSVALYSQCEQYRFMLMRVWGDPFAGKGILPLTMLNPSTATAHENDNTVAYCEGRANAWGYSGLCVFNLSPYRSTDPKGLLGCPNHETGTNLAVITHWIEAFHVDRSCPLRMICGWGNNANLWPQSADVINFLAEMEEAGRLEPMAFKINSGGEPKHPLYGRKVPEDALIPYHIRGRCRFERGKDV